MEWLELRSTLRSIENEEDRKKVTEKLIDQQQFARSYAIRDAKTKFRTNGDRVEHPEIATSRTQIRKLRGNQGSVFQSNFGIGKAGESA